MNLLSLLAGYIGSSASSTWLTTRVFSCSCRLRASDRQCVQKTIPEVLRRRSVGVSGRSARGSGGSDRRAIACVECLIRIRASACLFFFVAIGPHWRPFATRKNAKHIIKLVVSVILKQKCELHWGLRVNKNKKCEFHFGFIVKVSEK